MLSLTQNTSLSPLLTASICTSLVVTTNYTLPQGGEHLRIFEEHLGAKFSKLSCGFAVDAKPTLPRLMQIPIEAVLPF
jgi:hypothetical protein